jgi:putative transposase
LRWFYERRNVEEARRDLTAWLAKWQGKYPKLCEWVENNIEETFTFIGYPKNTINILRAPTYWSGLTRN